MIELGAELGPQRRPQDSRAPHGSPPPGRARGAAPPRPVWKALGGQVIGSVPMPAPAPRLAQRVAGVELDDRVVLVDPELGAARSPAPQAHPGTARLVAGEVGEGEVEPLVAQRPRGPEVEGGAGDGLRAGRQLALGVGEDPRLGVELEAAVVDQPGARREVGMLAARR